MPRATATIRKGSITKLAATRGLTIAQVASASGISESTLFLLDKGGSTTAGTLVKLRDFIREYPEDPELAGLIEVRG